MVITKKTNQKKIRLGFALFSWSGLILKDYSQIFIKAKIMVTY